MNDIQGVIEMLEDMIFCTNETEEREYTAGQAKECFETAISAMQELQQYREVGPAPDKLREIDKMLFGLCRELGEYQKLDEQGRLLKMPCAVGDTVYDIKFGRVRESKVVRFDSRECGIKNHAEHIHTRHNGFHGVFQTSQFGKTIFPTREEAEAKLAEMEGKRK